MIRRLAELDAETLADATGVSYGIERRRNGNWLVRTARFLLEAPKAKDAWIVLPDGTWLRPSELEDRLKGISHG